MREETRDMCIESLQMLKISAKRQVYTEYQQQQLSLVSEEIKFLSRQDLGKFAESLSKQMNDQEIKPYMDYLDRHVLQKMKTLQNQFKSI